VSSPTSRSLELLRSRGYRCAVVERFNPYARIRQDLFGIVDILAIRTGETLAVQTTSGSHVSDRVTKIAECDAIGDIRKAGWRVHVHGWRKSAKTKKWECREVDVS
jgi:hypothetical protein